MRLRPAQASVAFAAGCALALGAASLAAAPQATAGMTIGVVGRSPSADGVVPQSTAARQVWQETDFHLGLRGDVLFCRRRGADFGFGPYAEVMTHAFDEAQFGGGVSLLVPVLDPFPIVVSAGGYGRAGEHTSGLTGGLAATLFWGSRSFNYHGTYVMTGGLIGEMRYGLGPDRETSVIVGAQLDFLAMSLPFQLLFNAVRGGGNETKTPGS